MKIEYTFCHRNPKRSFFYKGTQFPVCSRCTGFYAAYFFIPLFLFIPITFFYALLLMIPAFIDGITQGFFNRESNNTLRFITGLIAGIGFVGLLAILGTYIGSLILKII